MAKVVKKTPVKKAAAAPEKTLELTDSFRLHVASATPVTVEHSAVPPKFEGRKRIHPRRILPRVVEGLNRVFHSTTDQVRFHMAAAPVAGSGDLSIVTNTELTGPGEQQLASNVGEPSLAVNGQVVFYTGNWYAASSSDGGQTFRYLDPFTAFPDPPNLGYCCDQAVQYVAAADTFVWLLQYGPKSGPEADNIQRLALAKSDDVAAGKWRLFDITTKSLGLAGKFLDFPDLAVSANFLYVTTNVFTPEGQSQGAAIVRIPIASIAKGPVTAQKWITEDSDSLRVAQNCGTKTYFAAHIDTSTLNVFTWDDDAAAPVAGSVEVARWIGGSGFHSRTPDGKSWLDRADPRITGATLAGTELFFAWSVDSNPGIQRPNPYVQIARIDSASLTLVENINIFDPKSAICYAALNTDAAGEVGITYMIGGETMFPSHVVGILTPNRKDVVAAQGERSPLPDPDTGKGEWGDYLTLRAAFPDRKIFAAAGYTMKGAGDGSNRDATPRFVLFGRADNAVTTTPAVPVSVSSSALPKTKPPAPPVAAKKLAATPDADGDPITDVNRLPAVSAAVAAQIKAAAGLTPAGAEQIRAKTAPESSRGGTKPGTERWAVKTGQDQDRAKVGKNVINGMDLGAGIVDATLEELVALPRPTGLEDAAKDPPEFSDVRDGVTEVTIWRIEAQIIALKHEADGDYHLVLQGTSGAEMVGEVPTPTTVFVGDSPWIGNIGDARAQVDDKLVKHLAPETFSLKGKSYVPHGAMAMNPGEAAHPAMRMTTPDANALTAQPLFQTAISPASARITGVGFFDRAHGQTGSAPNVIELHPVLKIEWL